MNKNTILTSVLIAGLVTTGTLAYAADTTDVASGVTNTVKSFTSQMRGHEGRGLGKEMGGRGGMMAQLTDAENTALEKMTDTEKQAFFEKKLADAQVARVAQEAKRDAHEAVIDKLVAGETLTNDEQTLLAEIKTERAAAKTQRAEMKVKREAAEKAMEVIKPILEKVKNKQTLTDAEQKQLYEARASQDGIGFGIGKGRGHKGRGFDRDADETSPTQQTPAVGQ